MRKISILCALLVGLFAVAEVSMAQEKSCEGADIEFHPDTLKKYPNLPNACDAIVTRDGKEYARVTGVVRGDMAGRPTVGRLRINIPKMRKTITVNVPPGQQIYIAGQAVDPANVTPGQTIRMYFPVREPEPPAQLPPPTAPAAATVVVLTIEQVEVEPEPMAALPSTASPIPLLALFGGLFVLLGGALSAWRRR